MASRTRPKGFASPRVAVGGLLGSVLIAVAAALLVAQPGCLERRDEPPLSGADGRCATCHGDPARAGDYLAKAAPPHDLLGATSTDYPGVGAHALHLTASTTHAAFACTECHLVPERTDSPGHADRARPAELAFGELARTGDRSPYYDGGTRNCTDSYCHGDARTTWTHPRSSDEACGTCHGLPPPAPHPQSQRCSVCHGDVIDSERHFLHPELHVDGVVEASFGRCSSCHGTEASAAPPPDTQGGTRRSSPGVGAHEAHLTGGAFSRPLACTECHVLPADDDEPTHIDGDRARVTLTGVAASDHHEPSFDPETLRCNGSHCHGPGVSASASPVWTDDTELGCPSCHGAPPDLPHPQVAQCSLCHGAVVGDDGNILDRERHVDGHVDVAVPDDCTSCHGSTNPAPPRDLRGHSDTSALGVGAHQTHVLGTPRSRPVPCGECHLVPDRVLAPGHVDTSLPAELDFSGVAVAFGAAPTYSAGTCRSTACHGAVFPDGDPSGGSHTSPTWTKVDGTQAPCGSCHGLPPPPPHPLAKLNPVCSACHEDIAPDNKTFLRPDLHVDGVVTFTLPPSSP